MNTKMNNETLKTTAPAEMSRKASNLWLGQVLDILGPEQANADIDLSRTTHIDSNGLAALLALHKEFSERGGEMRLINPARSVVQLLEITRMHRTVNILFRDEAAEIGTDAVRPILVVEDEQHVRFVAEMSMKPLGRVVLSAENGQEAIEIAQRENPAVIILDYMMPVMDGLETLRRLKADERTKHIPVIVMSANGKIAGGMQDQFEGASFFITKPFSPSSLRQEVHRLLQEKFDLVA